MGIKITGSREATAIQASQRSKQALGKKVLELGKEYILLFPKKSQNEIVVAGIVGRNCDFDALNISFGRILDSQMEVNPETGRIRDNSGMNRWAVLSSMLYKAAKARDISAREEEARKVADQTGAAIDENALNQAIAKVNLAYDGQKRHGDEAAVMPTKSRLVSGSIDFSIFTEAVLIPLDKSLQPVYEKAISVEVRLSGQKLKQINAILDNPNYNDADDDGFLEVKFAYTGADAKEAGKNPYQGNEKAIRKINLEKTADGAYVDTGVQSIAHLLNDTTHDPDIMFARAGTVSFAKTSQDVEAAMRKYLSNNRMLPLFIDFEDELTKRFAKDIIELGCVFGKGTRQYDDLLAIIAEQTEEEGTASTEGEMDAAVSELSGAQTSKEIEKAVEGNAELQKMVDGSDGLEDLD